MLGPIGGILTWSNTTIIADDLPNAVARMKQEPGEDLALIGSSHLASTLAAHGLMTSSGSSLSLSSSAGASGSSTACPNGSS